MAVIFPITASLLFRQTTGPWYNGSNAPGSGSLGELSYDNMDFNWYNLNSASYQIIETIKGAAYTGSSITLHVRELCPSCRHFLHGILLYRYLF